MGQTSSVGEKSATRRSSISKRTAPSQVPPISTTVSPAFGTYSPTVTSPENIQKNADFLPNESGGISVSRPSNLPSPSYAIPVKGSGSPSISFSPPVFGSPLMSSLSGLPLEIGSPTAHRGSDTSQSSGSAVSATVPTVITWTGGGRHVSLAGTFNDWSENISLGKLHDEFSTVLQLSPGTHRFKFLVDGEWRSSPDLPTVLDVDGNLINYLEIPELGISAFDNEFSTPNEEIDDSALYSRIMPNITALPPPAGSKRDEPPLLPPHLSRVILNSDLPVEDDKSLLPVPNHVVLNHLYALSIRDGVMVLGATSRYLKKYVTTILYKPVFA